ncbi:MAG: Fic family protein [Candidatus Kerfeldbacteria bacterium]|nr:Fic family protein [Candidatus Kerfeldbacteria bacterium]
MPKGRGETSYKDTAFGIIPRSKLIPLEIEGIKRVWDFVLQKRQQSKIPLTPEFLKKIHHVGFAWIFPEIGGKFRTIDVEVSLHTPPKFYLVPQLMKDFCNDLKERLKHLPSIQEENYLDELSELLAWTHHRFLWIHPFADYNGRIGRLLINIVLLNLDLPTIELQVETPAARKRYVKALQAADEYNLAPLKKIIEKAIEEAVKEI